MPFVIAPTSPAAPMTAETWNTAADPFVLIDYKFPLTGMDSVLGQTRKSKLYLVACGTRAFGRMPWALRTLVQLGGQFADEQAVNAPLRRTVRELAEEMANTADPDDALAEAERKLALLGRYAPAGSRHPTPAGKEWLALAYLAYAPHSKITPSFHHIPAADHSADLFRDVFEPCGVSRVSFLHDWRSSNVLELSRQMYAANEFSRMPILHDMLMDAGCGAEAVLEHCKSPCGHVRGCWVLDMILRKPG
jgi:hypothetical protein